VEVHEANFPSPLAHAIPCGIERALELCGANPKPPPPPPPPHPGPHLGAIYVSASCGSDSHSGMRRGETPAFARDADVKRHDTLDLISLLWGVYRENRRVCVQL
jgi:hypothetical protein